MAVPALTMYRGTLVRDAADKQIVREHWEHLPSEVKQVAMEVHYGRREWCEEDIPRLFAAFEQQGFKEVTNAYQWRDGDRGHVHIWKR